MATFVAVTDPPPRAMPALAPTPDVWPLTETSSTVAVVPEYCVRKP